MSEHTATVEVLTAEVRVLMVGSRQVTLSVYSQLDEVRPNRITPFGRVRTKRDSRGLTEVVGADADGNLCRAWLYDGGSMINWSGYPDNEYAMEARLNPDHAKEIRSRLEAWGTLPLIVLAGLR